MIDGRTLLIIAHLFGVIIGAGGAFASDLMFFSSIRDHILSKTELRFMRIGSTMVWVGLLIMVVSGVGLFLGNPEVYMASSKFQLKMTIVAIIIANGIFFHLTHIPRFHRHANTHLPSSDEFMRKSPLVFASGVVSVVSWVFAFILGALRSIPYSYMTAVSFYLVVVAIGVCVAMGIRNRILPHHKK